MAHRDRRLDSHLVTLTSPGSFAAEQYQGLRLTIERIGRNRTLQVIAVTSPAAGLVIAITCIVRVRRSRSRVRRSPWYCSAANEPGEVSATRCGSICVLAISLLP